MADKQSGAKHLTSLDFDISKIRETLEQVKIEVENASIETGKIWAENIKKGASQTTGNASLLGGIFDEKQLESAKAKLEEISKAYGEYAKAVITYDEKMQKLRGFITYNDSSGNKFVDQYKKVGNEWKKITTTITDDAEKRQKLTEKEKKSVDSLIEKLEKLARTRETYQIKLSSEESLEKNKDLINQLQQTIELLESGKISSKEVQESMKSFDAQIDSIKYSEEVYKKQQSIIEQQRKAWEQYEKERQKEAAEIEKQTQREVAAYEKAQLEKEKLVDNFYKKNMTVIDLLINEQERQGKVFSAQLKEQMELQVKQQAEAQKFTTSIETLVKKQKEFNTLVGNQKTSKINKEIIQDNTKLIDSLEKLSKEIQEQGYVTEEQRQTLEKYKKQIAELGGTYQEVGSKGKSFLQKTFDKAGWLGAFYIVNELQQGFWATIDVIKSTEDAVVNLQRVLNNNSLSQSTMADELYNIAYQYGRTFEEVSEVSTAFAQAGYDDWNDTLELTKGTMLALNTAELDVTQSTQGLIAIMSQWNLEAEEYGNVIDKINKTADNFAVTSENIVAALQRASSSAKNANISLEETIGIITALAEATGRSGENIGTALNSLIIYTSKASALETFAKIGDDAMKKVVEDYQKGAASIYDVWLELSDNISNLTAQQQKTLFESEMYQEFANELESQATEYTDSIKSVYGAAGTYRQNYFIALLNDMEKAKDAIAEMTDAEGYSATENEKYMQSLTFYWNQLQAALAELAVQFGEAGFLDLLKFVVQFATGLAEVLKYFGGINSVLNVTIGLLLTFKATKVLENVTSFKDSIKTLWTNLRNLPSTLKAVTSGIYGVDTAQKAATASATALQAAFGWIGIIITGASLVTSAVKAIIQVNEEARQASIEANNAKLEESKNIANLVSSYHELTNQQSLTSSQQQQLTQIATDLNDALGMQSDLLIGLTAGTEEYTKKLKEATDASLAMRSTDLAEQVRNYGEELEKAFKKVNTLQFDYADKEVLELANKYLEDLPKLQTGVGVSFLPKGTSGKDILDYYNSLKQLEEEIKVLGGQSKQMQQVVLNSQGYKEVTNTINQLSEDAENLFKTLTSQAITELSQKSIPNTVEEFKEFRNAVFESTGASEAFRDEVYKIVNDEFPNLAEQAHKTATEISNAFALSKEEIESFSESIKNLSSSVDSFQSGYQTLTSAVEEYNTSGQLSIDTIQSLIALGGDYTSLLQLTADGFSINEVALQRLVNEQGKNIDEMIRQSAVADALRIVEKYLGDEIQSTGNEAEKSMPKLEGLNGQIQQLIIDAWNGTVSVNNLANEIAKLSGDGSSAIDVSGLQSELSASINQWKEFSNVVGDSFYQADSYSKNTATAASNSAKSQTDALKKELEAQKEAIRDRYDAEIQALKDVQEENDRLQKQQEYYRNRQDTLTDISKAASRSGIEYREQEQEARNKLEELDREWQETVADWSIEDKIAELEALRDAEIAALDAQIEALSNAVATTGSNIVKNASNNNRIMAENYEKEFSEPVANKTKETFEKVGEEINTSFQKPQEQLVDLMDKSSKMMFEMYQKNFFSPMSVNLLQLQQQMLAIRSISPTAVQPDFATQYLQGGGYSTNSVVNYNTNQSANIFANVFGNQSASNFTSSIFTKP